MKRNKLFTATFFLAISLLLYSCGSTPVNSDAAGIEEARQAIAESNAVYFQAFAKGDSSIFIDRYAEDCCIMAPESPALCGPTAPLDFFRAAYYQFGLRNGKFITTNIFGDGKDFVTEEGLWQSFDVNNHLFDDGKFLVLWKKTSRGWKMFRDSFSSNRRK
jgi:ketosteroid isomerase-like protein